MRVPEITDVPADAPGLSGAAVPGRPSRLLQALTILLGLDEHRCPACGMPVSEADCAKTTAPLLRARMRACGLCADCARALPPLSGARCRSCGLSLPGPAGGRQLCGDCLHRPPPWQALALCGDYGGRLRQLILRFKHGGRPALAFLLAGMLLEAAACLPLPDVIVPVPQHPKHLFRRGYNQAHELAVALGLQLDLPVRPLLRRTKEVPPQTGLPAALRRRNPVGSFCAPALEGLHLWLVDDIITTGSTLRTAAEALRAAGARRVDVLALARTPLP